VQQVDELFQGAVLVYQNPSHVKMTGFEIANSWYDPPDILASKQGLTTLFFTPMAKKPPKPMKLGTRQELTAHYRGMLEENNWTQAELAKQMGVSRIWVTKVLKV